MKKSTLSIIFVASVLFANVHTIGRGEVYFRQDAGKASSELLSVPNAGNTNTNVAIGYGVNDSVAPVTQASHITFNPVSGIWMKINWANGDGTSRIVLMNTSNSFTDPVDGTDPTANATYTGSGEQVVYNGNENSISVSGLSPATMYWCKVYEYNGTATTTMYCKASGSYNPAAQTTLSSLCGTKTVGVGGDYATITAAISDVNSKFLCGAMNLLLTDSTYDIGETFPITINNNTGSAAESILTIKPAAGVNPVITCSTNKSAFIFTGSDYIIIDGSNTEGGHTKDLTIVGEYTLDIDSINRVISFENNGNRAATNSILMNCIIKGEPDVMHSFGVYLNDDAGGNCLNTTILNNTIKNAKIGIRIADADNAIIEDNTLGDDAEPLTKGGIEVSYCDNIFISGNDIFGQAAGNLNEFQYGISIRSFSTNSKITKNKIHDFYYAGQHGIASWGIYFNSGASTPTEISNNLIYNIKSDGDTASEGSGFVAYIPSGISIIGGGNLQIYYNSIYMTGDVLGIGPSSNYSGNSTCLIINAGVTNLDIKNNIFKNSMTTVSGTGTNKTYGVISYSANTAFNVIDFNDYYIDGLNPKIGYLSGDRITLSDWRVATAKDANSISADPGFVSDSDLHPVQIGLNNKGIAIPGITTDYADAVRLNPPDIGAYEFSSIASVTTRPATGITSAEATLNGLVNANNEPTEVTFEYGETEVYGNTIAWPQGPVTGSDNMPVSINLTGLSQNTTYHFRVNATTVAGIVNGADLTFSTGTYGINPGIAAQFEVYPVPSNGEFKATMISFKADKFNIQVYNSVGSLMYEKKDIAVNGSASQVVDLSKAPSGMYTVSFISGSGIINRKMIINHK